MEGGKEACRRNTQRGWNGNEVPRTRSQLPLPSLHLISEFKGGGSGSLFAMGKVIDDHWKPPKAIGQFGETLEEKEKTYPSNKSK
jgi:hypothetical protein